MNVNIEKCQLCQTTSWDEINTLVSGLWNKKINDIERMVYEFPIGCCRQCGHVQVSKPYTQEVFDGLYFSNTTEPDMWCDTPEGQVSPYDEMIDFFAEDIKEGANIVDFGCGAGIILSRLKERYVNLKLQLTGVDFQDHLCSTVINYLGWDLNHLCSINSKYWPNGIDIATSSHVLEHIIDPIKYLKNIANQLAPNGKVFIEVPDSGSHKESSNLAFTNLVHGQHIHYYTDDSLKLLASLANLKLLETRKIQTGDIPRLQMLFERNNSNDFEQAIKIQNLAKTAIKARFTQASNFRKSFYEQLIIRFKSEETIGLWGVGGDFYLLLKEYPELADLIPQQRLIMFDLDLAGYNYLSQKINSSFEIQHVESPVFITPMYAPTREKMLVISKNWLTNIIDPYKSSSLI